MTKAICLVVGILAVLVGWFSLTWGQPIPDQYIKKNGTTTTTASILFHKGITLKDGERIDFADVTGVEANPNPFIWTQGYGNLSIFAGADNSGENGDGILLYCPRTLDNKRSGNMVFSTQSTLGSGATSGYISIWTGAVSGAGSSYAGDINLYPGPNLSDDTKSAVVAIMQSGDAVPAEARGVNSLYVKGDTWVDGKITADDFIVAPANQALVMRGGTNEPVLVQMPTPTATPAHATNPNDLFVEGKTEMVGGAVLQANAATGYCAEFRSSAGVLGGYVLVDPAGSGALVIAPVTVADFTIGDFSSTALTLTGTSVSVTAGTSFNATADGGLMNVGRQSTPFVLKGKDGFDDEFSPIEAAPLHIYGGLSNGVIDGAPVAIGPTGETGSVLTGDYNLYRRYGIKR